uniref:RING-type E3 ubiquitin transferase n=1 Tax=Echeneis naucrates TaxID=173247 RepID=A0A665XD97_ECHNA
YDICMACTLRLDGGRRKRFEAMSAEVSPDSKCPICLDIFNNISYLDLCLHKFCFRCIHEWSKNKPIENGSFGTFG